ncbi:hypothetical protein GL306_10125 [Nocardia seriolae]|nr:hypothetical protein [Nocardia seriolae]
MQVVPGHPVTVGDFVGQRPKFVPELRLTAIDDRRHQPFDQYRVAVDQQPQRLQQIPAVDIQQPDQRRLDDIAPGPRGEVVVERPEGDEAAVVVGVGGGETPGAAAALDGEQHVDAVFAHDPVQFAVDRGDHRRVHGSGDRTQTHGSRR